jgi:hypothetical protein
MPGLRYQRSAAVIFNPSAIGRSRGSLSTTRGRSSNTRPVIRPLQRVPSWLPWLLATIGVAGLLLPWVLSPVNSDERYHYAAAPVRMADNVFNVLPWTINDIEWRMAAGRIAPVGLFVQHIIYLLGMGSLSRQVSRCTSCMAS